MTDIKPSILDYLGIEPIAGQGTSFLDLINGKNGGKDYVFGLASTGSLFVRSKKWKLMSDNGLDRNRYLLYDLGHDPREQHNVVLEHPEVEEYLEGKLRRRIEESLELRARLLGPKRAARDSSYGQQFHLDEEQKERLRSLGYVL